MAVNPGQSMTRAYCYIRCKLYDSNVLRLIMEGAVCLYQIH